MKSCASCSGTIDAEHLICSYCGTAARPLTTAAEQKQGLVELHHFLGAAAKTVERQTTTQESDEEEKIRARFLGNAFLPTDPELLFEEACRLVTMSEETGSASSLRRLESCVSQLELLGVEDTTAAARASSLRSRLVAQSASRSKQDRVFLIGCIAAIAVTGAVATLLVRSCG